MPGLNVFRPRGRAAWPAPACLALVFLTRRAFAHDLVRTNAPQSLDQLWRGWTFDPGVVVLLLFSLVLYTLGIARLWRATRVGSGVRRLDAASFYGGWLILVIALVSPLHALGNALFSAHMVQHELLMLMAAPLLVLGRPVAPIFWALPRTWARSLGRLARAPCCRTLGLVASNLVVAWLLHAVVLWMWHLPTLFQATLTSDLVHAAQHGSFLGSALLFWWAIIHGPRRAAGYGIAVLYLFTTAMHTGLLGALLSLAGRPWYPAYAGTTRAWGLSPLEDQQLGGLIMWIPAGIVYVAAGLLLFAAWLQESERRAGKTGRGSGALRSEHEESAPASV
jgi:putative membrane protein